MATVEDYYFGYQLPNVFRIIESDRTADIRLIPLCAAPAAAVTVSGLHDGGALGWLSCCAGVLVRRSCAQVETIAKKIYKQNHKNQTKNQKND